MQIGIIGSGVAGLATAVRLAANGHQVTVFESQQVLGGKMGILAQNGFRFDTGPSLFTQPYLMDELLQLAPEPVEFNYQQMEVTCHYFWEDGTLFHAYANREELTKELTRVFPKEKEAFLHRLDKAERMYDLVGNIFLEKPLHRWDTWWDPQVGKALLQLPQLDLTRTMHGANAKEFTDPRLHQLFDRYATYNGSNPYKAPAILNMIPHLELNQGTFYPKEGLRSVPETLIHIGKQLGVTYKSAEGVTEIQTEHDTVTGLTTVKGNYAFDAVVSNADVYPTYKTLLPHTPAPEKTLQQERSSSGIIFYWGINTTFEQLNLHNIFFSADYENEFNLLFNQGDITDDPTVYVNITSKVDPHDAPANSENWFVLINAPANTGQDWDALVAATRLNVIQKMSRILGTDLSEHIVFEEFLDPRTIESKTSSFQGSLYGTSSNNTMAAFLRHRNQHNKISNLYFCGGSVHPGGGIPLCLNSAKIVSELL
jgi:phytoene desaturase